MPTDASALPPLPGTVVGQVHAWQDGSATSRADWLAEESPVALVFNGITHAVMLASPCDLEDFALGFGLTEGLLAQPGELYGAEIHPNADGLELRLHVAAACAWRLKDQRRALAGRTGCGLCGVESLAQVRRPLPDVPPERVTPAAVARAQRELRDHQAMRARTGATHAAAWCGPDGTVQLVREDIGRHNALDKLVGALVRAAVPRAQGFVAITSRASLEMVQKAAMAGVGVLAAASAPTRAAVQAAEACGLALAGFVRGDGFVAYAHADRFGVAAAAEVLSSASAD